MDIDQLRHMRRHFSRVAKQYRKVAESTIDQDEREIAIGCVENCERIAGEYRAIIEQMEQVV